MEVKTFDISQLEEAKAALKEAFLREEYDENYNEWEFAQRVLQSPGYVPSLCLTAWQDGRLVGYNILTEAAIGESQGLALGPLGVRPAYQNQRAGSLLVEESLRRAKAAGYPWVAVLGGSYYARFGFEPCAPYGITVNAVCPGLTRTGINEEISADPELEAQARKILDLAQQMEKE